MKKVSQEIIRDLVVCLPPVAEQEQILRKIRPRLTEVDETIRIINKQVGALREYRQTLISMAILGRLDIDSLVPSSAPVKSADPKTERRTIENRLDQPTRPS